VVETDLAQAIAKSKLKLVGQVVEIDLAQPVAWAPKNRLVNRALEVDLAQPLTVIKTGGGGLTPPVLVQQLHVGILMGGINV
jgi:hypothetical protein